MPPMNNALLLPRAGTAAPSVGAGPTAVSFSNVTSTLAEDSDTSSAIRLADIVVTDDGIGTNTITLSGDSRFTLVGSSLYLAAGASLDYETNASHSTIVTATDDGGLGSAQATFVLTVQDVLEVTPPASPTGVNLTVIATYRMTTETGETLKTESGDFLARHFFALASEAGDRILTEDSLLIEV